MLKIALESLGCSKNLVDAEIMMGILNKKGYKLTGDFEEADVILVNTCGFIESAKQESIDTIIEFANLKETGNLKLLIVTGCLAQRYSDELKQEIPEIDAIVGTGSYQNIDEILEGLQKEKQIVSLKDIEVVYNEDLPRYVSTPEYMAYLKISEGCDKHCTYCIIPKLRGKQKSRKIEDILEEAKMLASKGIKELIVIAQDTTKYGIDIYGEPKLVDLLQELSKINGIEWIRFLYSYPEGISDELIDLVAENNKIAKYFDIPIQHISDNILKKMNRKTSKNDIQNLLKKIRAKIPDVVLRTSLIVGFPGETENDFSELLDFIKETKFDKLGAFMYSKEEGTPAAKLDNQIHGNTKKARYNRLMKIQQDISKENLEKRVGRVCRVLIENVSFDRKFFVGRTMQDAPDIDGVVFIKNSGDLDLVDKFVLCRITDISNSYDFIASLEK